ncbi:hypothetical protein PTTG_10473, partial [Puccinia triticina 1-1 BBBD Race 1]
MAPPKKTDSNTGLHSSSTRSAKPPLVPAGEFKRGGSGGKARLEPHDGAPAPDTSTLQASVPGGLGGQQPGINDSSPRPSDHDPQQSQKNDQPGHPVASDQGLESSRHAPKSPSKPSAKSSGKQSGEHSAQPSLGPKPPSSLCTPTGPPASSASSKRPAGSSSASSTTPTGPNRAGPERPHEGQTQLHDIHLRRVISHEPDDPGRLPVNRPVAGPQSRESAPL